MHPVLISLPIPGFLRAFLQGLGLTLGEAFDLHSYGVLIALGAFLGLLTVNREAVRRGLDPDQTTNIIIGCILAGLAGSRLLFIAQQWPTYAAHPLAMLNLREGGLVFQGGVIGGLAFVLVYLRWRRLSFWPVADVLAVGIPLGQLFGRMGCLAAGCCYGRLTTLPWAVTYPFTPNAGAPIGVPLHPVQLYESLGNLAILLYLLHLLRRTQRFHGQVFLSYCLSYGGLRLFTELARGDIERGFVMEASLGRLVSWGQLISLLLVAVALPLYLRQRARAPYQPSLPPPTPTPPPAPVARAVDRRKR